MKYDRLTKEQLEAMHEDFARFLATQQITSEEWQKIKSEKPQVAEEEIDIFSDLVWEKVLNNTSYLEKIEPQSLFLFKCKEQKMNLIGIRIDEPSVDLTSENGIKWLCNHIQEPFVSIFKGEKNYEKERNLEIFDLIKQGAIICKGEFYNEFQKYLS